MVVELEEKGWNFVPSANVVKICNAFLFSSLGKEWDCFRFVSMPTSSSA